MFDKIIGQATGLAGQLGITPDQVQAAFKSYQAKIAAGDDQITAIKKTAAETGLTIDKVQALVKQAGGGDIMGKLGGLF